MLGIVGVFHFNNISAFAHDLSTGPHAGPTTTAVEAVDEDTTKDFALHVKAHLESFPRGKVVDFSLFREESREEGGPWNKGNTYLIVVNKSDGSIVFHGEYKDAGGKNIEHVLHYLPAADLSDPPGLRQYLRKTATSLIDEAGPEPYCEQYKFVLDFTDISGSSGVRWACAVEFKYNVFDTEYVAIVGLHHLPEVIDDCSGPVLAKDVRDAETLRSFVLGAVGCVSFGRLTLDSRPIMSLEGGPWKSGDIYLFIMTEDRARVFFNGLNPEFDDTTLNITDRNHCNVGEEIVRVIKGQKNECHDLGLLEDLPPQTINGLPIIGGGFLQYLWARPGDPESRDPEFLAGDLTRTPGFEPKLSYVQNLDLRQTTFQLPFSLIIGSGIYPGAIDTDAEPIAGSDGGGCTIVSGNVEILKTTVFNLFLIVSAIFLGVWRKKT